MKKIFFSIIIVLSMLILSPNNISIQANTVEESSLNVKTIYPDGILGYENLSSISSISTNNNYIAYTLDNSNIKVFNSETREIIELNGFNNIYDFKFVDDTNIIVIDYTTTSLTNNIKVVNITTKAISILDTININNLVCSDIYFNQTEILIGIIKESSNSNIFELYEIEKGSTLSAPQKTDTFTNSILNTSYLLAINHNSLYTIFENSDSNPRICRRNYGSETFTNVDILSNIQKIDTISKDNKDYIIAFTKENLNLIALDNLEEPIHYLQDLEISDIEIFNDKIFISESNKKAIISYIISEEEDLEGTTVLKLKQESVLLSSANNQLGRFNSVSNIFIQGKTIVVSDTKNDRIQIIDDNLLSHQIYENDVDSTPHSVLLDSNQNLYFAKKTPSNNSVIVKYNASIDYDYTNSQPTTYTTYDSNTIGLISDMTIDNKNNVYVVDYTNNKLLALSSGTGLQLKYNFEFTTSENTQIEYLKGENKLVIWNNDILYLFDISLFETTNNPIISTLNISNCKSITSNTNSIIALCDNSIVEYEVKNSTIQTGKKLLENDYFSSLNNITLDIINKQIYGFNSFNQSIVKFDCLDTSSQFQFEDITTLTTPSVLALQIINNGILYDMPYNLGQPHYNVNECIGIEQFGDYYRVLFKFNNQLQTGFIESKNTQINNHNTTDKLNVITTNLNVPIYKYPTILKQNNSAIIMDYLPINTYITISYNEFPVSIDGKIFYTYEYDGKIGYIFNADVVLNDGTNIIFLQTNNASIQAIGEDKIYIYDEDKTTVLATLTNDDRIYVEDYDKKSDYTKITYKTSNLTTITGYIKTNYIEMDELDNTKIILICIIVASVVILVIIITSYILIKKKK